MFAKLRQRREQLRGVEFCDGCGQVCTTQCRSQVHLDQIRDKALFTTGILR